jgi:peptidoglycan/LPS O-acetylase OafA/YrhL
MGSSNADHGVLTSVSLIAERKDAGPAGATALRGSEARHFRTDIEGLRALAILLVVGFHIGIPGISGGFIGVDVFFVLSGYLITGLLVQEIEDCGRLEILQFYARRVRRLLPGAGLMIFSTLLAGYLLLSPLEQERLARAARATSVYLSNFYFLRHATDYFNANAQLNPLLHTWTLAVEEQFYILWPCFIVLTFKANRSRKMTAYVIVAVITFSLVYCIWQTDVRQPSAFFGSPARAWEFALGGLASLLPREKLLYFRPPLGDLLHRFLGWTGLTLVLASAVLFTDDMPVPGLLISIPVVGTAGLLLSGRVASKTGVGFLLSISPLQFIGRLSYSWYLWHWPILVLLKITMLGISLSGRILCAFGSLMVAMVSFAIFEKPIRSSPYFSKRTLLTLGMGAAIMVMGVGGSAILMISARDAAQSPEKDAILRASRPPRVYSGCFAPETAPRECEFGRSDSSTTIVLFGDSHAAQWFSAFETIANGQGWRLITLLKSQCPPTEVPVYKPSLKRIDYECAIWREAALHRIRELHPQMVILGVAHGYFVKGGKGPSYGDWQEGMYKTFKILDEASARTVLLRNTPVPDFDVPSCLLRPSLFHVEIQQHCSVLRESAFDENAFAAERKAAQSFHRVSIIDLVNDFCNESICPARLNGIVVYEDSDHISDDFARSLSAELARRLVPLISDGKSRIR